MRTFRCGDVVTGCPDHFIAPTEDALLATVERHLREVHRIPDIPADLLVLVQAQTRPAA